MADLRRFVRTRLPRRLLAVGLAYLLAVQALIVSIGVGMSSISASWPDEFHICSAAAGASPADGHQPVRDNQRQCPYCLVASQAGGSVSIDQPCSWLTRAQPNVDVLRHVIVDARTPVPGLHRTTGAPRGPPGFSV